MGSGVWQVWLMPLSPMVPSCSGHWEGGARKGSSLKLYVTRWTRVWNDVY